MRMMRKLIKIDPAEINNALNEVIADAPTKLAGSSEIVRIPKEKKYRTRKMYKEHWAELSRSVADINVMRRVSDGGALSQSEIEEALEIARRNRFNKNQESFTKLGEVYGQPKVATKVEQNDAKAKRTRTRKPRSSTAANKPKNVEMAPRTSASTKRKPVAMSEEVQAITNEAKAKHEAAETAVKANVKPEMSLLAQKLVDTAVEYVFDMDRVPADKNEVLQKMVTMVEDELLKKYIYIPSKVIEIRVNGEVANSTTEIVHEKFEDICKYVMSDIPVFLVGNAGTGKNHLCKQIAKTLNLEFFFTNAVTNEFKITGFIDAAGHYHETQFYKAFTEGGLFFLDEVDASIPETLVLMNAAIENRYFNFPNGKVDAHPNFRVIAAGNTYGSGADLQFVGRFQLDAASLDRFSFIDIDYDQNIENFIANGDTDLTATIRLFRGLIRGLGIRKIVSYRSIGHLAKMSRNTDVDLKMIFYYSLIKDMRPDDLNAILAKYPQAAMKGNKYIVPLKEALQMAVNIKTAQRA